MSEKILVTSALLYANGSIHFGHIAGAYLPADCYARFQRLQGNDVLYICGSDEYGVAVTLSAELAGRSPKEHVDYYHQINKQLFKQLNFTFDNYSRTTWEGHVPFVQRYFLELLKNGFIEEQETKQLYSEQEKRFLADRYVSGICPACGFEAARGDECQKCGASYEATDLKNPRSKLTGTPLTLKSTQHWFLRLDLFKDRLMSWIETRHWKPNVLNFVKEYIKELRPRAITRDMEWGVPIPLPDTYGKVLYVWFDAPIGYISSTAEWAQKLGDPEHWKHYWCDEKTKLVHFIGKDNIPFHSVIFPAMTMAQDQPYKLVDELPANEFLMLEGRQFSKSDNWYIDLADFLTRYSSDQIRYTLAANAPETADSEFTWKDFQNRCNSELLGKYGNLVNRILVFAGQHCNAEVPEKGHLEEADRLFLGQIEELCQRIAENYRNFKLRRATQEIMELAQAGNVYFDSKQPWKDAKQSEKHGRMSTTIACCLECLKLLALTSSPVIPDTAQKIWQFLGFQEELSKLNWNQVQKKPFFSGQKLLKPQILFSKIEDSQIRQELQKLGQGQLEEPALHTRVPTGNTVQDGELRGADLSEISSQRSFSPLKPEISIEDVQRLDLRVGRILAAEPLAKSNKLLKLTVDLGFEKRQIVAGIRQHYQSDDVIGQQVVIVANLKPARLMGVESQGMVLCAGSKGILKLITVNDAEPGMTIS